MVAQFQAAGGPAQLYYTAADESPVCDSTVRQRLRQATSAVHQALHQHPDFVGLLEERITFSGYRTLLARLYGFHWPLERGLRIAPPSVLCGFNVRARERASALRADLRTLGMSAARIDALPVCEALPPVRLNAEMMGRLYVVEGAALGGRVMASRLDGILGADGADGAEGRRFFTGRTSPDPLSWPVFCRMLEAGEPSEVHAVVESAVTTFRVLTEWLAESNTHV